MRGFLAAAAALLALAACKGVGDGRRPTALALTSSYGGDSVESYECATVQLTAAATFSGEGGDTLEDVSARSSWSSNDTGVAMVSNGDIRIPGSTLYYAQGTVIVLGPGTATITADYAGMRAQYGISASSIGELKITPELTRLAPETLQRFELETTTAESRVPLDLTDIAVWRIVTTSAPVALDGSTLTALTGPVDSPFVVEAALPLCGRSAQRELQLGPLRALQLDYDQPAGAPLPLGYSAYARISGLFVDTSAPPQDLGAQVSSEMLLGDASWIGEVADLEGRQLQPYVSGEPLQLRYTLESAGLSVDTPLIQAAELDLLGLRLSTDRVELELRDRLQLEAWGLFEDGIERPIRRNLVWSSRDGSIAAVTNGIGGGELLGQLLEGDTVIDVKSGGLEALTAEVAVHTYYRKPE